MKAVILKKIENGTDVEMGSKIEHVDFIKAFKKQMGKQPTHAVRVSTQMQWKLT